MGTSDVHLDWDFLKLQLPAGWRELAVERGLIHRLPAQLHTKITDIEQVLRLVFLRIGQDLSLQVAVSVVAAARHAIVQREGEEAAKRAMLVDLSAPGLHGWERRLANYFAELLARMFDATTLFSPMRWAGYEVVVTDGTTESCPGSEGTTARVLYALRLCDMQLLGCQVTNAHGSESMRSLDVRPGQLWICDRFYANPYEIAWAVDAGADVLVRYKLHSLPLYEGKEEFDVLAHARKLHNAGEMVEWPVEVRPKDHTPIKGRLCVMRLSDEAAADSRRRLRRDRPNASARAREAASFLILFTTAPAERLTTSEVFELYRLRWQVELEIRRDKSIDNLGDLPNFREDTVATWIYGKLLLQQIARKAISPRVALPPQPSDPPPSLPPHESSEPTLLLPPHESSEPTLLLPPHESSEPTSQPTPSQPTTATSDEREDLVRIIEDVVAEAWRVTVLLSLALGAALLPVRFHELPHIIAAYLGHIAHRHEKKRPKAIATFLERITAMARAGPVPSAAPG